MGERKFTLENIQCIKKAENITIHDKCINIKFGFNGLGKSSIGKGLDAFIQNDQSKIKDIKTYGSKEEPSITPIENLYKSVMFFDRDYANATLMQKTEVMKNPDKVFFSDPSLQQDKANIEKQFEEIKNLILTSELANYIKEIETNKFGVLIKGDGELSKQTKFGKGVEDHHVSLKDTYEEDIVNYFGRFFDLNNTLDWISWHDEASINADWIETGYCPYCGEKLSKEKKTIIASQFKLRQEFNEDQYKEVQDKLILLKKYVSDSDKSKIDEILNGRTPVDANIKQEIASWIFTLIKEYKKLLDLRDFIKTDYDNTSPEALKEQLESKKLDVEFFNNIQGVGINAVKSINEHIDKILRDFKAFYNNLQSYNQKVKEAVEESKNEINEYLQLAGIPYKFELRLNPEKRETETYIVPVNFEDKKIEPEKRFSFGELNSFSMALFGAIGKRSDSELIILDDPISSFDENKKFAVLHFLFNKDTGMLKNKTVLMLTHDPETLIDLTRKKTLKACSQVRAFLLDKDKDGNVFENEVKSKDIVLLFKNDLAIATDTSDKHPLISKLVHLRRYLELTDNSYTEEGTMAYGLISGLSKLYPYNKLSYTPINSNDDDDIKFSNDERNKTELFIRKYIHDFDVKKFYEQYYDFYLLFDIYRKCNETFDKAVVLRALINFYKGNTKDENDIFMNFLNDAYHFDNNGVYTFKDKNSAPPYIGEMCDAAFNKIVSKFPEENK